MRQSRFLHFTGFLLLSAALLSAGSAIVMALWNTVVTAVCGFAAVTFWQSLGLLTLGLTLSGGMLVALAMLAHGLGHGRHHSSRRELLKKWHDMTDEQRREFLASRGFSVDDKR